MSISKDIFKNINVINIILIVGLVLFLFGVVLPSYRTDIIPLPPVTDDLTQEHIGIEKTSVKEMPQHSDYSIVAENNLFHPERKLVISKGDTPAVQKPDFILYGTLIAGDIKVAYIEDTRLPHSSPGRGKRQKALHIGEKLSGYVLSEIYNDRVVMVMGGEEIEVRVLDSSKQRHKVASPPKPQEAVELRKQETAKQGERPRPPAPGPAGARR